LSVGVDHIFDDGLGLLHMACISQNFAAVQCLVAARIDASYRDTQGQSPLLVLVMFRAEFGRGALLQECSRPLLSSPRAFWIVL